MPGPFTGDPDQLRREVEEQLNQIRCPELGDRVERRVCEGDPAAEILRIAAEASAAMIVLGTHCHGKAYRLLTGSVAEEVFRNAKCPVLGVKAPCGESRGSAAGNLCASECESGPAAVAEGTGPSGFLRMLLAQSHHHHQLQEPTRNP
jgi:hypothetical protein